jgi:NADPH:quinone reductase-like Zn-dependent oxidoreductase
MKTRSAEPLKKSFDPVPMSSIKKIVCTKLGSKFEESTEIVTVPLKEPERSQVLVKLEAMGINASDINFTSGHYFSSPPQMPFDCGFEGIGTVVAVGDDLKQKFQQGDAVYVMSSEPSLFPALCALQPIADPT